MSSRESRRPSAQLFVGRLSKTARQREVEDLFTQYGPLIRCDVKYGTGMAYAFVDFEDNRDAEDAIRRENNREMDGQRIVVEWARGPKRAQYSDDECYKCGKVGHFARACRSGGDDYGSRGRSSRGGYGGRGGGRGGGGGGYGRDSGGYSRSSRQSRSRSRERRRSRSGSRDRRRSRDSPERKSRSKSRSPAREQKVRSRSRDRSRSRSASKGRGEDKSPRADENGREET